MRIFIVLVLSIITLFAKEPETIEIYASSLSSQDGIMQLQGDVAVVYGEYILTAKKARYEKTTATLELFDDVKIFKQNSYKILGKYAKINLQKKKRYFAPLYLLEEKSQVWLSASSGEAVCNDLEIENGVVSGCNPKDPLWQIEFSSSDYNAKTKWLNLYNTVLYIYDIPVLYTPYFGYSLDTTRRTGLLTPSFGFSNDEGLYFEQPFFIAEQNWWDLEFNPQIRTMRGKGIYGTFRFVDSAYSKGSIHTGYFKEDSDYMQLHQLANQEHFGIDLHYQNSNFLDSLFHIRSKNQSVIFLDTINLNDVDYLNLATNDTTKNTTASQAISRANIFYNTPTDYFGLYAKYYTDLRKESNKDTIQQLPTLHYHRYLDTVLDDILLYNFNIKATNLYRQEGVRATQTDLSIPIKVQTSLFDEYLNISYETQLYAQYSQFFQTQENPLLYENGYYARNYNQFNISTDLTKGYKDFIHSVSFSASYIRSGFERRSGFYETMKGSDESDPFYKITDIKEAITLDFSQYFYDYSGKQIAYHRLSDIVAKLDGENFSFGELESELDIYLSDHLEYYNNIFYNFTYNAVAKHLNKISYKNYGLDLSLSHFYKKDFQTTQRTSYITSSIKYQYNSHYSYYGSYDYDTVYELKKKAEVGFLYDKRCWSFGLKYAENNRPILTQNNQADSVYDRYIYFTILLKPIMKKSNSDFFGIRLPKTLNGS